MPRARACVAAAGAAGLVASAKTGTPLSTAAVVKAVDKFADKSAGPRQCWRSWDAPAKCAIRAEIGLSPTPPLALAPVARHRGSGSTEIVAAVGAVKSRLIQGSSA